MEVDDRMLGNTRDTCMAAPTSTGLPYQHLPVSYATYTQQALGSPQSIHMDTDAAMEFDTLKVTAKAVPPQGPPKELSAQDLVNHLIKLWPVLPRRLSKDLPGTHWSLTLMMLWCGKDPCKEVLQLHNIPAPIQHQQQLVE